VIKKASPYVELYRLNRTTLRSIVINGLSSHAPDFDKSCVAFSLHNRHGSKTLYSLEFENVVVGVSQLAESSLDLSLLHAVLGSTDSSVLTGTEDRDNQQSQRREWRSIGFVETYGPQTKNLVLAFSLWSLGRYFEIISLVTKPFSPARVERHFMLVG
jgi:hypothetical protein